MKTYAAACSIFLNSVSIEHYPDFRLGHDLTAGLITLEYFQQLRAPAEAIDFITTRTSLEELDFELTVRGF
jgi:hypothetical protein